MSNQELVVQDVSLLAKPTSRLLDEFGAGKASPGSGSAAALMGLLAAKLIITVCTKSLERPGRSKDDAALAYIMDQVHLLEPKFKELFEKDARDFEKVVRLRVERDKAQGATKKSALARESNDLLEVATDNAFQITEQCMKLIDHGVNVFEIGWPAVRGDSGAAISVAIAGVMSGIFITNLNLKTLKDRKFATENITRCNTIYQELEFKQQKAFKCVTSLNAEAIEAIQLELPSA